MISGAEIMIKCLERENVATLFGYPGAAICPFYDALLSGGPRHILVRQEQNAGHAASGYARISGRPGVCVTTSGPGATNLITAIASAYMDSIPLVAITGQVRSDLIGRDVFQEADITGACEPFTKHSYLVKRTEDLPRVFREAFHIAATGRPGPVLIDVPVDVQQQKIEKFHYPEQVDIIGYKPQTAGHAIQIQKALAAIGQARRPVLCAGGGLFASHAVEEFRRFAHRSGIPAVCTMMGIGALEHDDPQNLGMLGTHGVAAANAAIHRADLIILCGARVGDRAMASPGQIAERAAVIHIDIDPAEIGKNMPASIPIVGDVKAVLASMTDKLAARAPAQWLADCRARIAPPVPPANRAGVIEPRYFMRLLSEKMPDNAVLAADVGQNQIWSANHFAVKKGRFLTSGGMGTMGYSVPAAIGAKLADPAAPVCAVCGDGSFQMQMMELGTICQHQVDVKIVIMRNTRLGMVRELQDKLYGGRRSGVDLSGSPDFIRLAEAYGIPAARVCEDADASAAIDAMLAHEGAYLLECAVDPAQPSL